MHQLDVGDQLWIGARLLQSCEVVAERAGATEGHAVRRGHTAGDRRLRPEVGDRALDRRGADAIDNASLRGVANDAAAA